MARNNGRGDPAPTMERDANRRAGRPRPYDLAPTNRTGRPRPYDGEGFLGLRGLCVVGIVYCLNQDFQNYRIFRIGSVLYTFRIMSIIRYYDVFFNKKSDVKKKVLTLFIF